MSQPLSVNGVAHTVDAEPDAPLLYVLRNDLQLNGPKYGCGLGQCGACTVLVDGMPARSCVVPLGAVRGREVTTLEGLGSVESPGVVQQAFIDKQAAQCGYCINGMVMTAHALLQQNPDVTEADVRRALQFNLCRCGTHVEIMEAVLLAAHRIRSRERGIGMLKDLHPGAVCTAIALRAPDAAWNGRGYVGSQLESVDETAAIATGLAYQLVRRGRFCAVVAPTWEAAQRVHAALRPRWATTGVAAHDGTQETAAEGHTWREYRWHGGRQSSPFAPPNDTPAQALWRDGVLTLWARTSRSVDLAQEALAILGLAPEQVRIVASDGPADQATYDAAIDAAIVAHTLSCTVQVWPERRFPGEQTLAISQGARPAEDGRLAEWTTRTAQPDASRPSAAGLVLHNHGLARPARRTLELRAGYGRNEVDVFGTRPRPLVGDLPASTDLAARLFAQESFADEWARSQGLDPVQWRLEQLDDPTGRALIEQLATAAQWKTREGAAARGNPLARGAGASPGVATGRGFAYAHVVDTTRETPQQAWAAWVVDVSVDTGTGHVTLDKITVGHYLDELVIADTRDERWGEMLEDTARKLLPQPAAHDQWSPREASGKPAQPDAGGLPCAPTSAPVPTTLSASVAMGLPAAAAVANAIHDATGIRLREAPFHLNGANGLLLTDDARTDARGKRASRRRPGRWGWPLGVAGGIAATLMAAIPWRASLAPITPAPVAYPSEVIERGRLVAAAGDCAVCHTAPGGAKNAGGLAMDTPFGTIYTTNITSDPETGIGKWSYAAFERAMREGIGRDGRHLYPAFPYTSFAKLSDADMQALYAFLMSEPAVKATPPETKLSFPYSLRPMMAYWNLLFHKNEQYVYDQSQTPLWNRGAYLVQGPGHCMACHSPRNALGAEKNGPGNFLAGGVVDGWRAPALNGTAASAVPWTTEDLFQYLRTGHSERHGVAAGPMAPVVESLGALPDSDIHAMAVYLDSLKPSAPAAAPEKPEPEAAAAKPVPAPATVAAPAPIVGTATLSTTGKNLYEGACAACHDASGGLPLFGVRPSLLLNGTVVADTPDNLIRVILEGIPEPADSALGYMPGFSDSFNDEQIVELVSYLRARSAPERAPWRDLPGAVQRVRAESARHSSGGHP